MRELQKLKELSNMRTKTIKEIVQARKEAFLPNSRVILLEDMKDPFRPLPKGLKGTVHHVDDIGMVHVRWDNDSGLGVTIEDSISIVLYERFIDKFLEEEVLIKMGEMGYYDHKDLWDDVAEHYQLCKICERFVESKKHANEICMQCESGLIL